MTQGTPLQQVTFQGEPTGPAVAAAVKPHLALPQTSDPGAQILIVDDLDPSVRFLTTLLRSAGYRSIRGETNPHRALRTIEESVPDLLMLDFHMPQMDGVELLTELGELLPREAFPAVLVVTADQSCEAKREALAAGARDFVSKPFDTVEVLLRIGSLLEVRRMHQNLARRVRQATREIAETRDIALTTLARLADARDPETGLHLDRIGAYCRTIASPLRERPGYPEVDEEFVEQIERSSTLHDIGKVALPDAILRKPGALTRSENAIMREHARIGGDTISSVIASYPQHTFLTMAAEIAYQHHERWDGSGYPHGLAGREISLAARIASLADAYDAITSHRPYETARTHGEALERITRDSGSHFDPDLVEVFLEVGDQLDQFRVGRVGPERHGAAGATSVGGCPSLRGGVTAGPHFS
jgi:putative two-component system response regulator